MVEALEDLARAAQAVAGLDLAHAPAELAEQVLAVTRQVIDQLGVKRLQALPIACHDGAWARDGDRSFAAHVARTEKVRLSAAREELRVATRAQECLPQAVAAGLAGHVGVETIRAMARVADTARRRELLADPQLGESLLLEQAGRLGAEEFAKVCAAWAYRADPQADDDRYAGDRDREHLHVSATMGGWAIKGWLSPDSGRLLRIALDAVRGRPAADDDRAPSQRDAQALVRMAGETLDAGAHRGSAAVRPHLSVHVGHDTLRAAMEGTGLVGLDPARLDDGTPVPHWLLAKLACDGEFTRIVFGPQGEVLDVGRSHRRFTRAQRRALNARDGGCVWPGCDAPPTRCEAHHLVEWGDGGATDLPNGALLCWWHHDFLHRQRLQLRRGQPEPGLPRQSRHALDWGVDPPPQPPPGWIVLDAHGGIYRHWAIPRAA